MTVDLLPVAVLIATGLAVGFAAGLLGVGGCFIMVPVQYWLFLTGGLDPTLAIRMAFGTSLAVVLPTAASGAWGHSRRGAVDLQAAAHLGATGVVGAFLGGYAAAHLPGEPLRMIFGLVVLASAARMILFRPCSGGACRTVKARTYLLWGFPIGVICGLSGIGGGVLLVPVMVVVMGFDIHRAIGTSTLAIVFTSLGGIASYLVSGLGVEGLTPYSLGYIDLLQWLLLAGTSVPMARLGVRYAHRIPGRELLLFFTLVLIYIGLKMTGILDWLMPS
ncbi:MAG: sulfite exporter TauE/SafE family protein [Methanosarcinales archaeon]|nr:sulfite exporter TauE/SafE family protein [Methanosarcinales archaeon]